ncbi:hypothetical protein K474DRAFT_247923 [Panus rudis PR-1116 ss-1]|nr:hypothetical protein K474DRAFT_247923 [Panus rudis PR-1116 ss-1]
MNEKGTIPENNTPPIDPAYIPHTLAEWKEISKSELNYEKPWMAYFPFFLSEGYELFIIYYRQAHQITAKCMVEQSGPDKFGMIGNFTFMPPFNTMMSNFIWPAVEVATGRQVMIRIIKHVNDPPPSDDRTDLLSVYKYLLAASDPEDPRNHLILPLKFLEHDGWTFGVFPRWGEIQTGFGGIDMYDIGEVVDFLVQASEGLAYLHSLGIAHTLVHEDSFIRNILGPDKHPSWPVYRKFEPGPLPIRYGIVLHSIVRYVGPPGESSGSFDDGRSFVSQSDRSFMSARSLRSMRSVRSAMSRMSVGSIRNLTKAPLIKGLSLSPSFSPGPMRGMSPRMNLLSISLKAQRTPELEAADVIPEEPEDDAHPEVNEAVTGEVNDGEGAQDVTLPPKQEEGGQVTSPYSPGGESTRSFASLQSSSLLPQSPRGPEIPKYMRAPQYKLKAFVHRSMKGKMKAGPVNPYLARDVHHFGHFIRAAMLPAFSHISELDPLTLRMTSRYPEDRPTMEEVHQALLDIQTGMDDELKNRECSMEYIGKWPDENE